MYTTIEKELLAVVFSLDKFRSYLIGSPITIFTDHSALKFIFSKTDAKACLISWILLLQEFHLTIKDKKGVENVVVDHLSRSEFKNDTDILPVREAFQMRIYLLSLVTHHGMPTLQITWFPIKFPLHGVHKISVSFWLR